ncbi:amylo-alpha-1,6-glucosidase [Subtercola boreus]|uniref:Amylo-alpha-1,6-glucosidase n=1 Tax=Subtercola boreus TaxID=120213 RepID=A0A3E0WAI7_9MICO|nr:glycogen debranching N-terminal domain-containing protein [Subtercola boreus]RFA21042.1 amylo-alpha-1,6-glucosidase [Subtercola boreus]RFA21426.1 amylo-alpha-1,6-glucosidase [Subtercola boreus]RFA27397.1 amylo-alpha-1,6-glucosidase [Subtercola boreus]
MTEVPGRLRQPLLADELVVYRAPTQVWSAHDGSLGGSPIHGVYHSDIRMFAGLSIDVGGVTPESIATHRNGASSVTFVSLLRELDGAGADPRVRLDRTRTVADGHLTETLTVTSAIATPIDTTLTLTLCPDFSEMQSVKAGLEGTGRAAAGGPAAGGPAAGGPAAGATPHPPAPSTPSPGDGAHAAVFEHGTARAALTAPGATTSRTAGAAGGASESTWPIHVAPHSSTTVTFTLDLSDSANVVAGPPLDAHRVKPSIRSDDTRLAHWVETALDDLDALRLVTRAYPDEPFLAAGAPWFFTLFGRDSLWAARFLLPFGTELAGSTLKLLARLQGTREVADTAEQPGKIMHELRASELLIPGENVSLPPLYYGTVDATALWIILLHDAWTWGLDDATVRALLPNLRAALAWMRDYGDSDGDGFLEYVDTTGHGLANQGWKDSGDSIQWRDGTLATGPIALCEVQGYAHEAAVGGAALLAHFAGLPDVAGPAARPAAARAADSGSARPTEADEWLAWADALKQRFADHFWIDSPHGAYPAVALDASKRRVDTVTSNIGHLLGTGILTSDQAALIAARLVSPELSSGYGLRTMSTDSAGYWPLSYHGGSVWAHDTAIAIAGLGREGLTAEAAVLIEGLLAAAEGFDYRMPELHSGDPLTSASKAVPYPAACRPQAWSAAAAVSVLTTTLGLNPDAACGTLAVNPIRPAPAGALTVTGLRVGSSAHTIHT